MDERTDAKRSIESSTRHLTEIAHELSRRASPRYISDQAKEKALYKTQEWTEQVGTSPLALGIIGGTIGLLLGRALGNERKNRAYYARNSMETRTGYIDERGVRYTRAMMDAGAVDHRSSVVDARGFEYGGGRTQSDGRDGVNGEGLGEKIAGTAHDLKEKAGEVVANVRDRIPSPGEMVSKVRDHLPSMYEVEHKADENPMMVALGGLALGAVAALLLPVSRKERELLAPVKRQAGEAMGALNEKLGETAQHAKDLIDPPQPKPQASQTSQPSFPAPGGPLLTH